MGAVLRAHFGVWSSSPLLVNAEWLWRFWLSHHCSQAEGPVTLGKVGQLALFTVSNHKNIMSQAISSCPLPSSLTSACAWLLTAPCSWGSRVLAREIRPCFSTAVDTVAGVEEGESKTSWGSSGDRGRAALGP